MKRILAFLATTLTASAVQFTWDVVPDANVIGYRAYSYKTGSSTNVVAVQSRTNNFVNLNLPAGTNFVFVTSVSDLGLESLPSNVLTVNNTQPPAPQNLVRQVVITVNLP